MLLNRIIMFRTAPFIERFPPKEFNVIHQETAFKIDCVLRKSTAFQKNAFNSRANEFLRQGNLDYAKDDLIISKLWWAKDSFSEKQLTDVKNLLRGGFDNYYIRKWTDDIGIERLFEQCRREIEE